MATDYTSNDDCSTCLVEKTCHYPHKPCACVLQRKYMSKVERDHWDEANKPWSEE